jgi:hypothetical protein
LDAALLAAHRTSFEAYGTPVVHQTVHAHTEAVAVLGFGIRVGSPKFRVGNAMDEW